MFLFIGILFICSASQVLIAGESLATTQHHGSSSDSTNAFSLIDDSLVLLPGDHEGSKEYFSEFWNERFLRACFNAIETNNFAFLEDVFMKDLGRRDYALHKHLCETNSHVLLFTDALRWAVIDKMVKTDKQDMLLLVARFFYGDDAVVPKLSRESQFRILVDKVVFGDVPKISKPKTFGNADEKEWKIHITTQMDDAATGEAIMIVREYEIGGKKVLLPKKYKITAVY